MERSCLLRWIKSSLLTINDGPGRRVVPRRRPPTRQYRMPGYWTRRAAACGNAICRRGSVCRARERSGISRGAMARLPDRVEVRERGTRRAALRALIFCVVCASVPILSGCAPLMNAPARWGGSLERDASGHSWGELVEAIQSPQATMPAHPRGFEWK